MKIESGKYYRARDGQKVGPMRESGHKTWPWIVKFGDGRCWNHDGTAVKHTSSVDLIAEWIDDDTPVLWRDMTPEQKGALLLAHHEGRVIQSYIGQGDWVKALPGWNDNVAYRVKPESSKPREFWIVIYDGTAWDSEAQAQKWAEPLQSMVVRVREVLE